MNTIITSSRWQSKTLILSTNVDQKSLETEFSIPICRPAGDKWQSKTLFLAIFFDPCSSPTVPGVIIASFIDIPMLNVKYVATHKVQMHAGSISNLMHGSSPVRAITRSLKLVDYLPLQTHSHTIT